MAKYEMRGGGFVAGDNAREILEAVRGSSFNPEGDLRAFLRELARRCKEYAGSEINTEDLDKALADLVRCGFLSRRD